MRKNLLAFLFLLQFIFPAQAQRWAVKTNLLYDAVTVLNMSAEVALSRRYSLDVSGHLNPWTFSDNKKFKHWLVQPELRRWNCEPFNRGYWGVHLLGGQYNAGNIRLPFGLLPTLRDTRYQGWMVGVGISYGYQWYLGAHWNLEATVALGYIYTRFDAYECYRCGRIAKENAGHHYWGPTRIGISIVYLFNHK